MHLCTMFAYCAYNHRTQYISLSIIVYCNIYNFALILFNILMLIGSCHDLSSFLLEMYDIIQLLLPSHKIVHLITFCDVKKLLFYFVQ